MLENIDFIGLFRSQPMIPDCMRNDDLIFNFYNRNGTFNINIWDGDNSIMLFEGHDFEVTSANNNDTFQITIEELEDNHPYKQVNGKLYIRVPEPRAFKLHLNEYGWVYFQEII
ncbi:hypothetical protein [Flavobacterium limnophilum]|uniref:hypothetical protein n=1 Tax=Flavobacterium limnophilum TaxID=3003262 RepID=UPI002482E602|nr:hypothetical protein [Flavobacterium limnophilum]